MDFVEGSFWALSLRRLNSLYPRQRDFWKISKTTPNDPLSLAFLNQSLWLWFKTVFIFLRNARSSTVTFLRFGVVRPLPWLVWGFTPSLLFWKPLSFILSYSVFSKFPLTRNSRRWSYFLFLPLGKVGITVLLISSRHIHCPPLSQP